MAAVGLSQHGLLLAAVVLACCAAAPALASSCDFQAECRPGETYRLAIPCEGKCSNYIQCQDGEAAEKKCGKFLWQQKQFDAQALECVRTTDCDWWKKVVSTTTSTSTTTAASTSTPVSTPTTTPTSTPAPETTEATSPPTVTPEPSSSSSSEQPTTTPAPGTTPAPSSTPPPSESGAPAPLAALGPALLAASIALIL
ncbi:threonine-rich protein-like [Frankliniella occidentalis]|uniref:Threonine-rich protein-like n=1 Tax=Frankliniella occidentalis TaxID=133901 RepID=A0A9C6TZ30_FRAOC|nr:threonine-rich protein-like [Frankliniella occidentalis]